MIKNAYSYEEFKFIINGIQQGKSITDVANEFCDKFGNERSSLTLQRKIMRTQKMIEDGDDVSFPYYNLSGDDKTAVHEKIGLLAPNYTNDDIVNLILNEFRIKLTKKQVIEVKHELGIVRPKAASDDYEKYRKFIEEFVEAHPETSYDSIYRSFSEAYPEKKQTQYMKQWLRSNYEKAGGKIIDRIARGPKVSKNAEINVMLHGIYAETPSVDAFVCKARKAIKLAFGKNVSSETLRARYNRIANALRED